MSTTERTLRALHVQADLEVIEATGAVATAIARLRSAREQADDAGQRCRSTAEQLRAGLKRRTVNPALQGLLRELYDEELQSFEAAQRNAEGASEVEQHARGALTMRRYEECVLDRAVKLERQRVRARRDAIDFMRADEQWLMRAKRQKS